MQQLVYVYRRMGMDRRDLCQMAARFTESDHCLSFHRHLLSIYSVLGTEYLAMNKKTQSTLMGLTPQWTSEDSLQVGENGGNSRM